MEWRRSGLFVASLVAGMAVLVAALGACGRPGPPATPTPTSVPAVAPSPTPLPTPTPTPTATFSLPSPGPTPPIPRPVRLPADEAPHGNPVEWWYYNGHLTDERGREYGFHFVVFQLRGAGGVVAYSAHVGIADLGRGDHQQQVLLSLQPQPQLQDGFSFQVQGWELQGDPREHRFQAGTEGYSLELAMAPTKPAALHGEDGWLQGPGGWTYYYSWTRMEAEGTLTRDGTPFAVRGAAWMDHQWGDFTIAGPPAGWQWFAVQLEDGSDLMVSELRDGMGTMALIGTLVRPDGNAVALDDDDLSLEVLDRWTSPHTGADYPAGWRLRVKGEDLDVEMRPRIADQEITQAFPPSTIYWEGVVSVDATRGGQPLAGKGYAELVGYVPA